MLTKDLPLAKSPLITRSKLRAQIFILDSLDIVYEIQIRSCEIGQDILIVLFCNL